MRSSNAARLLCRPIVHVTSDGERAVVLSVYDEVVHVQGDGRGLRIGGTVPGIGVLDQYTISLSKPLQAISASKSFRPYGNLLNSTTGTHGGYYLGN